MNGPEIEEILFQGLKTIIWFSKAVSHTMAGEGGWGGRAGMPVWPPFDVTC